MGKRRGNDGVILTRKARSLINAADESKAIRNVCIFLTTSRNRIPSECK